MTERRQSKQRNAILKLMKSTTSHPGAQWVYEQLKPELPDLSLGTVYRNIKLLTGEESLASVGVVKGEERFDGEPRPHSHAVCTSCGRIVDLDETISMGMQNQFPEEIDGFTIDLRKTVFYGLCTGCKTGKKTENTAISR